MAERKTSSAKNSAVNPDFAQFREVDGVDIPDTDNMKTDFFDSPSDIPDDFDERNSSGLTEDDVSEISDPFIDADNVDAEALSPVSSLECQEDGNAEQILPEEEPVEIFIPALDDFDVSDEVICINMKEFVIPKNKSVTVPRYVRDYYYTLCKQKSDFASKRNALAAPKD